MYDQTPNAVEIHMLRIVRDPRVTAAMLADAAVNPPHDFRPEILDETQARVLHDFPVGEQRRYWHEANALGPAEQRARQQQAWRYGVLKARLVGAGRSRGS